MRLLFKLTVAIALGIIGVLIPYGITRVEREVELFDREMKSDHEALGRALTQAAEAVAERSGLEQAVRMLDDVNATENQFRVEWRRREPGSTPAPGPEPLVLTHSELEEEGTLWLVTRVPVTLAQGAQGSIEVRESLAARSDYIHTTILRTVGQVLLSVAVGIALVGGLGWLFVGRPIRLLCDKVRRVAEGDLSGPVIIQRRDEMADLAREINAMCDELAASQAHAEREGNARLRALEQLRHAERLSTVGTLASGMAHEIGTPLNVLCERARMIARGETPPEEIAADARVVVEQGERIARIIRQLLDFARRSPPDKHATDLRAVVASTCSLLEPLAQNKGVELTVVAHEDTLMAEVDPAQLQQVVTNLVINGIQAQPDGGRVCLRLGAALRVPPDGEDAPRRASPHAQEPTPRDYATITVEDDGEGMAPAVMEHVFEPFFTTKATGEGTGLGLSVAYGIVRDHEGFVDVESHPGRGSRFVVHVPLAVPA